MKKSLFFFIMAIIMMVSCDGPYSGSGQLDDKALKAPRVKLVITSNIVRSIPIGDGDTLYEHRTYNPENGCVYYMYLNHVYMQGDSILVPAYRLVP